MRTEVRRIIHNFITQKVSRILSHLMNITSQRRQVSQRGPRCITDINIPVRSRGYGTEEKVNIHFLAQHVIQYFFNLSYLLLSQNIFI